MYTYTENAYPPGVFQAYEDEKTMYHGGGEHWAHELSMDQPSYGSIFLQLREANTESDNSCDFLRKAADIFGGTCGYIRLSVPLQLHHFIFTLAVFGFAVFLLLSFSPFLLTWLLFAFLCFNFNPSLLSYLPLPCFLTLHACFSSFFSPSFFSPLFFFL